MRFSALIAALGLSACSPPAGETAYSPTVEMNFMRACEAQSTMAGLCACTWGKIETGVPPADFAALESLPGPEREANPLKRQIDQYAYTCARELTEQAPTP